MNSTIGALRMPYFNDIPQLPEDPILGLPILFAADPRPNKINLGIGAYKTAEGAPLVLASVKKAEALLLRKHLNKEYLPIEGDPDFLRLSLQLLFGSDSSLLTSDRFFAAQSVGGASAIRIGAEFLAKLVSKTIFISQPTWSNHKQIFERAGLSVGSYPYFNPQTRLLDYDGMCEAIRNMPSGSVILLHGCCHNPTGIDPTFSQWEELCELIKKQKMIPFFDMAYQGFGEGIDQDAQAIRHFAKEGHEMLVAYSFSKNFGLYGERVGFLTIIGLSHEQIPKIGSQVRSLIRANYSNPPLQGARIVSTILKSHELTVEWKIELHHMSDRIRQMRQALVAALMGKGSDRNLFALHDQKGLFSFCGLTIEQVQRLRKEKGIYTPNNGRINIAGLNIDNVSYLADALLSVM